MPNCQGTSVNRLVIRKSTCPKIGSHTYSSTQCHNKLQTQPPKGVLNTRAVDIQTQLENQNGRKYHVPRMNTILREANQMGNIEALRPTLFKTDTDLTPRSKAAIAPKVTQRLNFNTDEVIFKNLTPINVNDSILIHKQCNANPKKFTKSNQVPSPELYHWLEPLPALKHIIPEPEISLEFCEQEIDPFESYLRLLN